MNQIKPQSWIQERADWYRERVRLYEQVRQNVAGLLGKESLGLKKYQTEYDKGLRSRKFQSVERVQLLQAIDQARVVYIADFHALQQSQKAQLRILKALALKRERCLAVECIQAKHQKSLDLYINGQMPEAEFLQAVQWEKTWGFPWENYRPLFLWARRNRVPVLALNLHTRERTAKTLKRRDAFAGDIIAQQLKKQPTRQLFVIFGDWHLADKHLPGVVRKAYPGLGKKDEVIVFQNSEELFFRLLKIDKEYDIVRINEGRYCVLGVPPWVKWQSYLLYLESQADLVLEEDELDFTDPVAGYCEILARELGATIDLGFFSVYSANDDIGYQKITDFFSGGDLKWFTYLMATSRSFYCPELGLAFLGKPSVNEASGLAMLIVHSQLSARKISLTKMPADFERQIYIEAMAYLGSKMINPKRKTDTVADIRAALGARAGLHEGRESLRLALAQKMLEMKELMGQRISDSGSALPPPKNRTSYFEAARILGGMMGERIYTGYRERRISRNTLLKLLRQPIENENFKQFYLGVLEMAEAIPEPFKSKSEKL